MFDGVKTTKGLSSRALICNVLIPSQGRTESFQLSLSIEIVEAGQWGNMQLIKAPTQRLSALGKDTIKAAENWDTQHQEALRGTVWSI